MPLMMKGTKMKHYIVGGILIVAALIGQSAFAETVFHAKNLQASNERNVEYKIDRGHDGDETRITFVRGSRKHAFGSEVKATRNWSPDAYIKEQVLDNWSNEWTQRHILVSPTQNYSNKLEIYADLGNWKGNSNQIIVGQAGSDLTVPGFTGFQAAGRVAAVAANLIDKYSNDKSQISADKVKRILVDTSTRKDGRNLLNVAKAFSPAGGVN